MTQSSSTSGVLGTERGDEDAAAGKRSRCHPRHDFAPVRGADKPSIMVPGEMLPQKCDLCAARYPCAHACDHIDCRIERGEALPDWVTEVKPTIEPTTEVTP